MKNTKYQTSNIKYQMESFFQYKKNLIEVLEIRNWKFAYSYTRSRSGEKIRNLNKGFSLVELVIYMGLFSVLIAVLSAVFMTIMDAKLEAEATATVDQDGRFILARLMYDIHRASSISQPTLGNQDDNLQIVIDGVTYSYTQSGGNLTMTVGGGSPNMLNSSETTISGLAFEHIGNSGPTSKNTIRVNFTITSNAVSKKGAEVRTMQTVIGIR